MYIPLDNLYDWMDGIDPDLIIYRFYPHGSKNLQNLRINPTSPLPTEQDFVSMRSLMWAVCHDQEPLDPSQYDLSWQQISALLVESLPIAMQHPHKRHEYKEQAFCELAKSKNVACVPWARYRNVYDRWILIHSEKNSTALQWYESIGAWGVHWWAHAMIARDWYRFSKIDARLRDLENIDYEFDFNLYSRSWTGSREYRLALLQNLITHALDSVTRVSINHHDQDQCLGEYQPALAWCRHDATHMMQIWQDTNTAAHASATYDVDHYRSCAIDLVAETVYVDGRIHLTEKTLRPLACGKPFLLLAGPGSLQYVRDYGFKTFDALIDETYDKIQCPQQRLAAVVSTMKEISRLPKEQKRRLIKQMHCIARDNQSWFHDQRFADRLTTELQQNLSHSKHMIQEKYMTAYDFFLRRRTWSSELRSEPGYWIFDEQHKKEQARFLYQCIKRRI